MSAQLLLLLLSVLGDQYLGMATRIVTYIIEKALHHPVISLCPHRHRVRVRGSKLLERGEQFGQQSQTDNNTPVVGDVIQTTLDEFRSQLAVHAEAQESGQSFLRL